MNTGSAGTNSRAAQSLSFSAYSVRKQWLDDVGAPTMANGVPFLKDCSNFLRTSLRNSRRKIKEGVRVAVAHRAYGVRIVISIPVAGRKFRACLTIVQVR
jgi:hypothetical protein